MADYLLPECSLSISDKTEMFAFRCQMNDLPNSFGKQELCDFDCQEIMSKILWLTVGVFSHISLQLGLLIADSQVNCLYAA